MSDLIDRQEVIETLKKTAGVGNRAIEKIEALPTAEPKWIPTTERKPEIPCLACDANTNVFIPQGILVVSTEGRTFYLDGEYYSMVLDGCMVDGEKANFLIYENRITAWMPLPDPYEEI